MIMMKHVLIFAVLVVATQALGGKWKQGLSVRWGLGEGAGRDFFIPMPQTMREAQNARWVLSPRPPNQPRASLVLMNPSRDDVAVGTLYDCNGDIAGLQVALPEDSFDGFPYSWEGQGFTKWTAPANSQGVERTYWITCVYFVGEDTLAKSHEEREASRNGPVLQDDYVYVTGFNGQLWPISIVASEVADTAKTGFTRQACVPYQGRHFFYNMSTETECTTESILPWFALLDLASDSNQLVGVGVTTFGKLPKELLVRDYFERSTVADLQYAIPDGPQCFYDSVGAYGSLSIHIFFVESPLLLNCLAS